MRSSGARSSPRFTFRLSSSTLRNRERLSPLRSFAFLRSPPSRSPARPSLESGVSRLSLSGRVERERERERDKGRASSFSLSHRLLLGAARASAGCSPDFFAFLRLSSVTVPTPSRSPTRPPRADRVNGPCRWAHGHGRLLGQRRGTYGRGRKKKESIGLALFVPRQALSRERRNKSASPSPFFSLSLPSLTSLLPPMLSNI